MMQADRARWTHTKASSRRARQIVGRVSWPEHCVQVRQTTKQVVVQRFGLTTERKAAPRPTAAVPSSKSTNLLFSRVNALLALMHAAPCLLSCTSVYSILG